MSCRSAGVQGREPGVHPCRSEAGTSAPQLQHPAVPVQATSAAISNDGVDDAEADMEMVNGDAVKEDVELDPYMLPVSHEVALEGNL